MNCLNLVLDTRNNILDGITLYEPIDVSILDKLINSTLLREEFNHKIMEKMHNNEKQQLEKYRELVCDGRAIVKYTRSDGMRFGRCNPLRGLGLYPIRREIRHTLVSGTFEDIDIDNCHPVMLEQVMVSNDIQCPCLQSYIGNRNKWFDLVREFYKIAELESVKVEKHLLKDIPKNLFLRIMFGGGAKQWKKDNNITIEGVPDEIIEFEEEVKKLSKIVSDANPELMKEVVAKKDRCNLNGSVCSYFLQEKENIILEVMYKYCVANGYIKNNEVVLCADGFMIPKKLYKVELLKELEAVIYSETGFKVGISNKPMEQGYNAILDKHLKFNLYKPTFTTGLLADHFKTIYSNIFVVVNNELYQYNGVYWMRDKCSKNSSLHTFVDTVYYKYLINYINKEIVEFNMKLCNLKGDELDKAKVNLEPLILFLQNVNSNLRSVKRRKDIIDDICIKLTNNNIEFDTNPHLLAFTNKVYDLSVGEFIEPCYSQYISMTTDWEWCSYYSEDKLMKLDKLLNSIFPNSEDVKEYYLETLSTGLYGQQIEKLFIATGGGGNGKSLINSFMMVSVGEYGYKLPSSVILQPIKEGANPAVANMHKKRFCLVQEPDEKQRICSATLKELTGDASINCRTLYSTNTKTQLHLSLFLECNKLPKLDEVNDAVQRRIEVIPFVAKFVDKDAYESLSELERIETNTSMVDTYYKTDEFKVNYKQALMMVLMDKFKKYRLNGYQFSSVPNACKVKAGSYLATSDDIYTWFIENFERTDDNISYLYLDDIYSSFMLSSYYTNMNKKDKRELNKTNFSSKFSSSIYLQKYVKDRKARYAGIQHSKQFIINFKRIDDGDSVGIQSPLDV